MRVTPPTYGSHVEFAYLMYHAKAHVTISKLRAKGVAHPTMVDLDPKNGVYSKISGPMMVAYRLTHTVPKSPKKLQG